MATSTGSKRKLSVNIEALEANNTLTLGGNGVATQSWVNSQLSGLVDSAPSTLDTLNELAAALGDDPNFATTVTNSIAGKLPLSGGTMTGSITLGDGSGTQFVKTYYNDGSFTYQDGTGFILNRTSSYIRPDVNRGVNLYIGGYGIGDYDFNQIKINSPALYWNDETIATQSWVNSNTLNQSEGDARYLQSLPAHNHIGVHPYIDSSTADSRGPDFDALLPDANQTTYKEVHAINEGTNIPTGAYTYGVVHSQYMTSMKFQWYVPHTASRGNSNTQDTIYFRTNWGSGNWYGWKYLIHSGNIAGQSVNYASSAGAVAWGNVTGKPSTFAPSSHNHDTLYDAIGSADAVNTRIDEEVFPAIPTNNNQLTNGAGYITGFDITTQTDDKYIRSNASDNVNAHTEWQDGYNIRLGNGADFRMYHSSNHTYFRNFNHTYGNMYWQAEDTEGTNHAMLYMISDTSRPYLRLYENGSERLRTTSAGVEVFGVVTATDGNSSNWNTAYSWGNHASAGYLTSFDITTQTDSKYVRSDVYDTTNNGLQVHRDIGDENGSWESERHTLGLETQGTGNIVINFHRAGHTSHNLRYNGSQFRFDDDLESTGVITASGGNSTNWNTAYEWGNHSSAGYLTSLPSHNHDSRYYTESESDSRFASRGFINSAYVQFTVDGEPDVFYPVRIGGGGAYAFQMYSVSRRYNWTAPDTWNTASHRGGLTLTIQWSGDTAWGGNDKSLRVIQFDETYSTVAGGMALPTSGGLLVWLRGGGAVYHCHSPRGVEASVSVDLEGYEASNGTRYEPRSIAEAQAGQSSITNNWPVRDYNDLYDSGDRVATQTWVTGRGYLTSVPSEYLTQTEGDARYLTDLPNAGIGAGTYGSTSNQTKIDTITVDAKGRVTAVATGTGGDITTVRLVDDSGSYVQDTGGTAVLTIAGGAGITTSASGTTITVTNSEAGEADAVRTELDPRITELETNIATKAAAGGSYGQDFTADDMRVDQWFRNTVSGKGLYNDATANHWYSDSSSRWRVRSGSSSESWILMCTSNNTARGSFYANSSNQVGILDADNHWAVRVVHDSYVEFRDNNEVTFRIGQGGVDGNYGTVQTHGGGKGGWEGYSINGRFVFMSADSSNSGIYNDTDNEWMTRWHRNGATELYHNGSKKLETTSSGATVTGTMTATAFSGDGSALTGISAGAPPVDAFVEGGEPSTLASITFSPGEGVATFTLADGSSYRLAFAR